MLCDLNWRHYDGHCYYFSNDNQTMEDARTACTTLDQHSDLVSIHSQGEQDFLKGKSCIDILNLNLNHLIIMLF